MKQFSGFPDNMDYTGIPAVFFSTLLPEITDIAELKTTLHIFRVLLKKKGVTPAKIRFVSFDELASDVVIITGIRGNGMSTEEALRHALNSAVKRGTFLHISLDSNGKTEEIYLLNTRQDRQSVEKILRGEIRLPGLVAKRPPEMVTGARPNVYTLYEQNIGLLTPMIAEELKEAEKLYPKQWLEDAFKEAVNANRRNWKFILKLLEQWATEGKSDGTYQRDIKTRDPDKFIKGKYGHLFKR